MIETIVLDVGETITRDDRYWHSWADWLDIPRLTLSALVGAVVAQGRDNADAVRLARPGGGRVQQAARFWSGGQFRGGRRGRGVGYIGGAQPWILLGPAKYAEHKGSKPTAITWELTHEIPADV